MTVTVWHHPTCSTCRRARKWLAERGIEHEVIALKDSPPDAETLRALWTRSGLPLKRFFNTSGQSYRAGGWRDRIKTISDGDALAALAADGMLIKRPLVDAGHAVLVGFKEAEWEAAFGG